MPIRFISLLCGGLLLLSAAPVLAAAKFDVDVRVEGKARTLVKERTVTLVDAPIIKDGNPDHSCSGQAAIGALQAGTEGRWKGKWFEGLGYSADAIMGNKPKAPGYFELWINHKYSTSGLCAANLKAGDSVLLFVQDCTYDPKLQACAKPVTPLGLHVAKRLKRGKVRTVRVVDYDAKGKTSPEPGATVFVNGRKLGKTNKQGEVTVKGTKLGTATLYATDKGHARSETESVRIVK